MGGLFIDDIDAAADVLESVGYPTLAGAVRELVRQNEQLTALLDEAHDQLAKHRDDAIQYVPVTPVGHSRPRPSCCEGTDPACTHQAPP